MVLQATYFNICENTLWIGNFCLFDQPCGEALQIVSWTFDRLVRIVTDVSDNFYVVSVPKLAAEQDYCRLLAVCGKLFLLGFKANTDCRSGEEKAKLLRRQRGNVEYQG